MNTCPHDPHQYEGCPIGMYHCPVCGEMVLAGMDHPDYSEPLPPPSLAVRLRYWWHRIWG